MGERRILGIDPGLMGALGWVDGKEARAFPMPTLNSEPDLRALADLYMEIQPDHVVLEQAQAARSATGGHGANGFKIGVNYGLILGQLRERGMVVTIAHPATWKAALKLTRPKQTPKEGKARAIALARDLFPNVDLRRTERGRVDNDGIAESLLLAEYGRRFIVPNASEKASEGGESR